MGIYLLLTFTLSPIVYHTPQIQALPFLPLLRMWVPGFAALLTMLICRRTLRGLGWARGEWRYLGTSYVLPVGYCLAVYGLVWATGLGGFFDERTQREMVGMVQHVTGLQGLTPVSATAIALVVSATFVFLTGLFAALGEEIGWRGLLVPQLSRITTFTRTALLSGIIWAAWHYPLLFQSQKGVPAWFGALCFTVMLTGLSFAYAWLRLRSGSLWPAAVLHASHNLFVQTVFDHFTTDTGVTWYLVGEFGAALALASVGVGYVFWKRRETLVQRADAALRPGAPRVLEAAR